MGTVRKNWRNINAENAPCAPKMGMSISGYSESDSPHPRIWKNSGTMMTSMGIISAVSSSTNRNPRPGKRSRANAYPDRALTSTLPMVPTPATSRVLRICRAKGCTRKISA